MGKLENTTRTSIRKTKIQEAIIASIAGKRLEAGNLVPVVINYLFDLNLPIYERKHEAVSSSAARLKKYGLLSFSNNHYQLTRAGRELLDKWRHSNYTIKTPHKWDRKWRVIIFDVPEKKRSIRSELRIILKEAGFLRLQDSVWVHPYDCEDVIGLIKTDLGIGKYLLYMIVDQLENDRFLRMDFGLTE